MDQQATPNHRDLYLLNLWVSNQLLIKGLTDLLESLPFYDFINF